MKQQTYAILVRFAETRFSLLKFEPPVKLENLTKQFKKNIESQQIDENLASPTGAHECAKAMVRVVQKHCRHSDLSGWERALSGIIRLLPFHFAPHVVAFMDKFGQSLPEVEVLPARGQENPPDQLERQFDQCAGVVKKIIGGILTGIEMKADDAKFGAISLGLRAFHSLFKGLVKGWTDGVQYIGPVDLLLGRVRQRPGLTVARRLTLICVNLRWLLSRLPAFAIEDKLRKTITKVRLISDIQSQ
jgi:hypothetical protein